MHIKKATLADLEVVTSLFEAYLRFYRKEPNPVTCQSFISDRLNNGDSTILIAVDDDGNAMGFTQVYYSFTSVGMAKILILNDLYVESAYRQKGAGRALMDAVKNLAAEVGAIRFDLETEAKNTIAQKLYEDYGMKKSEGYYYYSYSIK